MNISIFQSKTKRNVNNSHSAPCQSALAQNHCLASDRGLQALKRAGQWDKNVNKETTVSGDGGGDREKSVYNYNTDISFLKDGN